MFAYQKPLETVKSTDVIVIGGGTAGVCAAIAAAREGLNVIIIEELNTLGGTQTNALVTPMMASHIVDNDGHTSVSHEIHEMYELVANEKLGNFTLANFDPMVLKITLEFLCEKYGIKVIFSTKFVDVIQSENTIKGIICADKSGLVVYEAKVVIDGSGDALVAQKTNEAHLMVNEHTGKNQAISLRFEMSGVDTQHVGEFLIEGGQKRDYGHPFIHCDGYGSCPLVREMLLKSVEDKELTRLDVSHFQFFSLPGRKDALSFNCPELGSSENVLDIDFIAQKNLEGKHAILRIADFMKKHIPGCENAVISEIAPILGVRQSYKLESLYTLTIEDVFAFRKFEDGIVGCNYPVDVHGGAKKIEKKYDFSLPVHQQFYEIPYRSLVPVKTENLLVVGRSSGFDFFAQSSARIQYTCRAMGEAAGIAAASVIKDFKTVQTVDGSAIKNKMSEYLRKYLK
jgi:ribulose 1,5-bisphosphate synthetase/thiazole synthase